MIALAQGQCVPKLNQVHCNLALQLGFQFHFETSLPHFKHRSLIYILMASRLRGAIKSWPVCMIWSSCHSPCTNIDLSLLRPAQAFNHLCSPAVSVSHEIFPVFSLLCSSDWFFSRKFLPNTHPNHIAGHSQPFDMFFSGLQYAMCMLLFALDFNFINALTVVSIQF